MATSLLQIRVEDSLKDEAAQVFERLGIDTSTAVRMFLKRTVIENGIPFRMTLPKTPYNAERGYRAMIEIGEAAEKNGLANMSLDEINAEIEASRRERKALIYGKAQGIQCLSRNRESKAFPCANIYSNSKRNVRHH